MSFYNDTNFFTNNLEFLMDDFFRTSTKLQFEKLPIITENGGIFSCKVR